MIAAWPPHAVPRPGPLSGHPRLPPGCMPGTRTPPREGRRSMGSALSLSPTLRCPARLTSRSAG